jgi:hypothetical protein
MAKNLDFLIIHCTYTPGNRPVFPDKIREWHTAPPPKGRGWKQVGYSDMILLNGSLVNLIPYDGDNEVDAWEISNGVAGMNSMCRHVVYVGGSNINATGVEDTRNAKQILALRNYVFQTLQIWREIKVAGHYAFDSKKDCPSFDVEEWCAEIGVPDKNIFCSDRKITIPKGQFYGR